MGSREPCENSSASGGASECDEATLDNITQRSILADQPIQQETGDGYSARLENRPVTPVELQLHVKYNLLMHSICQLLEDGDDVTRFNEWAAHFDVNTNVYIHETFLQLDERGVITGKNLERLVDFLKSILRNDIVDLIRQFLKGDYALLDVISFNKDERNKYFQRSILCLDLPGSASTLATSQSRVDMDWSDSQGRQSTSSTQSSVDDHGNDDNDLDDDSQWLCNHCKRRCSVKFYCCEKYWPCHHCHNNESKCGQTKLKCINTMFVKCVKCDTQQQFGASCQYCSNCHIKFAKYFCKICKQLTGTDDNPYHCEKCGECRTHEDRSFHCDVCGVCLDVQLRGNHKCRADSAHDKCFICQEDTFTGCQILPCSHKVHEECAIQMIRNGLTRCPICQESFAHKLKRRNVPTSI